MCVYIYIYLSMYISMHISISMYNKAYRYVYIICIYNKNGNRVCRDGETAQRALRICRLAEMHAHKESANNSGSGKPLSL